jgi:hypothetical protein
VPVPVPNTAVTLVVVVGVLCVTIVASLLKARRTAAEAD